MLRSELFEQYLLEVEQTRLGFAKDVIIQFGHRPMLDLVSQAEEKPKVLGYGVGLARIVFVDASRQFPRLVIAVDLLESLRAFRLPVKGLDFAFEENRMEQARPGDAHQDDVATRPELRPATVVAVYSGDRGFLGLFQVR